MAQGNVIVGLDIGTTKILCLVAEIIGPGDRVFRKKPSESRMNKLLLFMALLIVGCSKEPVNMDEVLFDRAGRWITNDNYSSFFFYNINNSDSYLTVLAIKPLRLLNKSK